MAVSAKDKSRTYRQRMETLGLRPIQIWVPDTRTQAFAEEARRQSLAVASSAKAEADQSFIEEISDS
jgi:hypothetical protein